MALHSRVDLQLPPTVMHEYRQKRKFDNSVLRSRKEAIQISSIKNNHFWDISVNENWCESYKNNEQFLFPYNTKKQGSSLLLPSHLTKAYFQVFLSPSLQTFQFLPQISENKSFSRFSLMVLTCLSLVYLVVLICFGKNYGRTYDATILMQILHEYYRNTAPSNMKNK